MSVQAIADLRRLKLDTVESYLAEAMTAGKAYHWHRLHVPDNVVATVSEHALAQLASAAGGDVSGLCKGGGPQQCTEADPAMPEGPCMYSQISQKCDEDDYLDVCCAQRVPEDQDLENERSKAQIHVSGLGGGDLTSSEASNKEADARDRHIESNCVSGCLNSSATLTAKGAEGSVLGVSRPACADEAPSMPKALNLGVANTHSSSSGLLHPDRPILQQSLPCDAVCRTSLADPQALIDCRVNAVSCGDDPRQEQGIDLLSRLQELGLTIKILKEQLPESIRFGQIRLCLAHSGRLSLLQGC